MSPGTDYYTDTRPHRVQIGRETKSETKAAGVLSRDKRTDRHTDSSTTKHTDTQSISATDRLLSSIRYRARAPKPPNSEGKARISAPVENPRLRRKSWDVTSVGVVKGPLTLSVSHLNQISFAKEKLGKLPVSDSCEILSEDNNCEIRSGSDKTCPGSSGSASADCSDLMSQDLFSESNVELTSFLDDMKRDIASITSSVMKRNPSSRVEAGSSRSARDTDSNEGRSKNGARSRSSWFSEGNASTVTLLSEVGSNYNIESTYSEI